MSAMTGDVCRGCLSRGRRLRRLLEAELECYNTLVGNLAIPDLSTSVLCWECVAGVRRAMRLRETTRLASDVLLGVCEDTNLPSLSHLSTTSGTVTHYISHEYIEEPLFVNIDCNDVSEYGDTKESIKTEILDLQTLPKEQQIKKRKRKKANNIIDIKDKDIRNENERKQFKIDKNEYKITNTKELKPEPSCPSIEQIHKITQDESTLTLELFDFDSSDDEPLTVKKMKKEDSTSTAEEHKVIGVTGKRGARVAARVESLGLPAGALQMILLSWEQVEAERQRALQSERYTRQTHRCEQCALGFNHRTKLDKHLQKHAPSAGAVQCAVCGVRCRHQHALDAHVRRHRVRWQCSVCGSLWSRAAVAADHFARTHTQSTPTHTCPTCGHVATSLGRLRSHLKCHSTAPRHRCDICTKTFRDRASLRTHLFIHAGEKEFSCTECDKRFLFRTALTLHQLTHQRHQHLYCHQCDVTFKNRMSLYQHMKYNLKHIDPDKLKHACSVCGARFVRSSRLQEHIAALHTRRMTKVCTQPDCNYSCASGAVLRAHIRAVHRGVRARRDHVCHRCGNRYTSKKSLEGHLRAHSGERPFACTECNATFTYHAALYNHTRGVHHTKPSRVPSNRSNNVATS